MNLKKPIIGVIGGKVCNSEEYDLAVKLGNLIAKSDSILICGGMGGIMEAVCKGASEAGGITIGVIPTESNTDANQYVRIPIVTGMGIGRNIIIVRSADAVIAINGKYGTLSEIAFALQLKKPVFVLNPWINVAGIHVVSSAEEAIEKALDSI